MGFSQYRGFIFCCFLFVYLLGGFSVTSSSADEKARKVMQKVYAEGKKHKTQETVVEMVISDVKNRQRQRYFRSRKLIQNPNISKSLIRFFRPANVSGTSLLNWKDDNKDNVTQWLYLPALKNVKQLNADSRNDSFMGSDFSYADIAGRQLDQDEHSILQETEKFVFVQSVPKKSSDTYSKIVSVIDPKLNIARRVVFYDRNGTKLKTLDNKRISNVKGMNTITLAVMTNHQTKGSSTLQVNDIKVGQRISPNDVGIQALRSN